MSEDVTLELRELRAALLEADEQQENEPIWKENHQLDEDSFLRLAASVDVETLIESIATRANRLKQELSAAALALAPSGASEGGVAEMSPFAPAPNDALETLTALKADLAKCSGELVSHSSLARFEAEELEARELKKARIARLEHLVSALHLLASHQRACEDFDRRVNEGNMVEATKLLNAMDECTVSMTKISSSTLPANKNNTATVSAARVAKAARVQCRARRAALQSRLDEAFANAIVFDSIKHELVINLEIKTERLHDAVRLEQVIEACRTLNILSPRLQERVAQPLLSNFFIPLTKSAENFALEQDLSDVNRRVIRLKDITSDTSSASLSPLKLCQKVLDDVQVLLRFVWSEIFNRDASLNQQLNIYASIEPLLKGVLRDAVPESFQELASFGTEVVDRVTKFDQELQRIGVALKSSERLSEYVSDVDTSFARKLRERYLERVRAAIKSNALQTSERVDEGEEPEFLVGNGDFAVPGEMRVSRTARTVVKIAEEALVHAESAPTAVCVDALIKASRNSFDMFRVLVPFLRKDEISVNPRAAMLHRNDCDYVAHHLLLLSHRHRALKNLVTVDLAPFFFDEADTTFLREVELRCKEIEKLFTPQAPGDSSSARISIDFNEILAKSDSIFKAWSETLPQRLADLTKAELGEALANGAFQAVCSSESNVASLTERRSLLKRLVQFSEAVKSRGASSRKVEQLCKALQPHMSLPLFADLVESDLSDWPPESLINLAKALFGKNSSTEDMRAFEEKILYY